MLLQEVPTYYDKIVETYKYENFIVFENHKSKLPESELFGDTNTIQHIINELLYRNQGKNTLSSKTTLNKLYVIQRMIDLVRNPADACLSKFYSRNNKQHQKTSHYGERFITLSDFISIYPKENNNRSFYLGVNPSEVLHEINFN